MGDVINATADLFGFGPASKAAEATESAAKTAAKAAEFRPYNITTALGGVTFGKGTAAIDYNPELAAYRDALFQAARRTFPTDIAAAEETEYQTLRSAAAPAVAQQYSQLGTKLFRTGRQGLDVYGAQPELRAFQQAQIDREAQLRQLARTNVANKIAQSTGLFTSGAGVESTLLQPLEIGAQLGGRSAAAGANAANMLFMSGAAKGLGQAQSTQGLFGALPTYKDIQQQGGFGKYFGFGQNQGGGVFGGDVEAQAGGYYGTPTYAAPTYAPAPSYEAGLDFWA